MSNSAARQINASDLSLESTKRAARYDAAQIKKKNIKSPDTGKMHRVSYGNTHYFFRTKKKMKEFIDQDKHHSILGVNIPVEDKHLPTIEERFSHKP